MPPVYAVAVKARNPPEPQARQHDAALIYARLTSARSVGFTLEEVKSVLHNHRVLVLNSTYEAINICTARRALKLLICGVADAVEESAHLVVSPTVQFPLPEVIRLRRFVRLPYRPVPFCRKNILLRDSYRCQYCGTQRSPERLTLDHVLPISRGGADTWTNVVTACKTCNHRKGNHLPDEIGMKLLHKPRTPNLPSFLHLVRIMGERRATWRKYLFFDYNVEPEEVAV